VLLVLPTTVLLVLPTTMLLILLLGCGRARRRGGSFPGCILPTCSTTLARGARRGLAGARLEELEGLTTSAKSWSFFRRPPFFGMFQSPANTMKRVVY
jgi:hypothetical protein